MMLRQTFYYLKEKNKKRKKWLTSHHKPKQNSKWPKHKGKKKDNKILRKNLTKLAKDLHTENYKALLKENLKDAHKNRKTPCVHGPEYLALLRRQHSREQSTD